ncbi:MAG: histone deacetylase [Herpetosiphonaceae bacterium]|nr:MAG: histone deacetylase [Herpetosiphonaceae bacterium]
MTVAILTDDQYMDHDYSAHPENAERLRAIKAALERSPLRSRLAVVEPRPATDEELLAAHTPAQIQAVSRAAAAGRAWLDVDTYVRPASYDVARLAAGAVVRATEAVLGGEASSAFALVRPPGHHATRARAMGFCLFNNVAVAAYAALNRMGLERVAIIDWDVHHGNGTQDIFWEDGRVLYCSTHGYGRGFYPGTGAAEEIGVGAGHGTTLNVPLPFGAGDEALGAAFEQVIIPALRRFNPQLILISAGYDAHWADPLGSLTVSLSGYAHIAAMVYNLAQECCEGRIVCALEGGYNTQALASCVLATLQVLTGEEGEVSDPFGAAPAGRSPSVEGILATIRRSHPLLTAGSE